MIYCWPKASVLIICVEEGGDDRGDKESDRKGGRKAALEIIHDEKTDVRRPQLEDPVLKNNTIWDPRNSYWFLGVLPNKL